MRRQGHHPPPRWRPTTRRRARRRARPLAYDSPTLHRRRSLMSVEDRRRRFRGSACGAGAVRDAEPVGRRVGAAARRASASRRWRRRAPDSPGRSASATSTSRGTSSSRTSRDLAAATRVPLNVDSERCFADEPGGVAETVRLLAEAGAAGCSIEDYDPRRPARSTTSRSPPSGWRRRPRPRTPCRADGAHRPRREPPLRRRRPRRHDRAAWSPTATRAPTPSTRRACADLDAHRAASSRRSACRSTSSRCPRTARSRAGTLGVRRVSTGSLLTSASYAALVKGAEELLGPGTSSYAENRLAKDVQQRAFGVRSG